MDLKYTMVSLALIFFSGCSSSSVQHDKDNSVWSSGQGKDGFVADEFSRDNSQKFSLPKKDRAMQVNFSGQGRVVQPLRVHLEKPRADIRGSSSHGVMKGSDVQLLLKQLGYYKGRIDGDIGPMTKVAIVAFQNSRGLKGDGIAGPQTKKALLMALHSKYKSEYRTTRIPG